MWGSMLVRVSAPPDKLPANLEIVGLRPGKGVEVVVSEQELSTLIAHGLATEIIIQDVDRYLASMAGSYRSLAAIETFIDNLEENFSALAKKFALGTTYEGRTIWAVKISDNVETDEAEPELLFMGLHHAREWPSVEICLFLADSLTKGYGSDSAITDIVNNREIWIVPCVNPDGYHYCHDLGNDWRQNRRYFPEFGTYGVDLNRNYNTSGNGVDEGEWGSINGSSTTHFPEYSVYCGPEPFSEAETKAIRDLVLSRNFIIGVSYHTYSELLMWPWGYSVSDTIPDNSVAASVGQTMASLITTQDGTDHYTPEQTAFLYPTTGDVDGWLYGFSFYSLSKNLLSYTVEAGSEFIPPESQLDQLVRENFDGAFYLCTVADSIENLLTPPVVCVQPTGPDTAGGNFTLDWTIKNQKSQPQYFALDELEGNTTTDSAETGDAWIRHRFTLSTLQKHSGIYSFHSFENGRNTTGSLTTRDPIYIMPGDSLRFWCFYDIEENFDYASVEVSTDGRDWTILEGFTGNSGGWLSKAYSLESYEGSSIFIRFRYTIDEEQTGGGFFVDDIYPVARYDRITTVASNLSGPTCTLTPQAKGTYYYRVKGFNSRGFGDYSPLKRVVVSEISVAENNREKISEFEVNLQPRITSGRFFLKFKIPKSCPVRLSMYDASGQKVACLFDRPMKPGAYSEEFKLAVPSGVYFLHFEAQEFTKIAKLLVLR